MISYIKISERVIERLKESVMKEIRAVYSTNIPDLSKIHEILEKDKINELRMKIFDEINTGDHEFIKLISKDIFDDLVSILGPDISVQKKLNFSIHMPGDSSSVLDIHSDTWSGESPFQLNLWFPLTSAEETNSMFLLDKVFSIKQTEKIFSGDQNVSVSKLRSEVKDKYFLKCDPGKGVLFNTCIFHGNVLNSSNKTRISFNIRYKGTFHPESSDTGLGVRSVGKFFIPLILSENSQLALKYLNINYKKPLLEIN